MSYQVLSLALLPALVGSSHSATAPGSGDEVLLVQRSLATNLRHSLDAPQVPDKGNASWVTGPFGPCLWCSTKARIRNVWCASYVDGTTLPHSHCSGFKPDRATSCKCDIESCHAPTDQSDCDVFNNEEGSENGNAEISVTDPPPQFIGCFEQAQGDDTTTCHAPVRDYECSTWNGDVPCRSGVGFYRHCNADRTNHNYISCAIFCRHKSLDIFGIVNNRECRCGASILNRHIWNRSRATDNTFKRFNPDLLQPAPAGGSGRLCVYRYEGVYESGVVLVRTNRTITDQQYEDSIVQGRVIQHEEDTQSAAETLNKTRKRVKRVNHSRSHDPMWTRHCHPIDNCGPANIWNERQPIHPDMIQHPQYEASSSLWDIWQDYVIVRFEYAFGLDEERKEAWRNAAGWWEAATCIRFQEAMEPTSVHVDVRATDLDTCEAVLGRADPSYVNLGWCKSLGDVGSIAHEIGHVLGMNHPMMRPDASYNYHGHGPHLYVHWENINPDYTSQFQMVEESYIGSNNDGGGDPHPDGYAEYDYNSIMQYGFGGENGTGEEFVALDYSGDRELVGQRVELSPADIEQVNDMYQCWRKDAGVTSTTTAPAVAFTVSGSCDYGSINGNYKLRGHTSSGAPYYQKEYSSRYLYYEPMCGGNPAIAPMWIFNSPAPSEIKAFDLDSRGECFLYGHSYGGSIPAPPLGENSWRMYCQVVLPDNVTKMEFVTVTLDLAIPTTTTVTTTTTTTTTTITTPTTIATTRPDDGEPTTAGPPGATITGGDDPTPAPGPPGATTTTGGVPGPAPGPPGTTTTAPVFPTPPPSPTTTVSSTTAIPTTTLYHPPVPLRWIEPVMIGCLSVLVFGLSFVAN